MVTCSRCGEQGHTRRSTSCPGLVQLEQGQEHGHEQPQQQPQQQAVQYLGTIFSFIFCADTFVEPNADLYDRVLIGKQHFVREFVNRMDYQETDDDKRVFLIRITSADTAKSIIVNVGGPHREYDNDAIYAPQWILQALNINETGNIFWERVAQPPPRATKISLRPIDTLINEVDGRTEIEEHLKNFNVIQEGVEIQIPLRPFDNYLATVYVEKLEPAREVLLRDEVELDLLGSVVEPQWQPRPPTPIPAEPPLLLPFSPYENNIVIPTAPPPDPIQTPGPDQQTRRQLMAAAAERRRLAALAEQANTTNASSN